MGKAEREQLRRAKLNGWVSVDERMPEFNVSVLVYTPPRDGFGAQHAVANLDEVWGWDFGGVNPAYHDPTHWRQLPEAPGG